MTKAVLLSLFSLLTLSAQAQTTPAAPGPTPPTRTELTGARGDTLAAIGRLYERRRAGGIAWTIVGGALTGTIIGGIAGGNSGGDAAGGVVSVLVVGGVPAGIGISKLVRFSPTEQAAAEQAYREGQPLPRSLKRRFKRKDFNR